MIRIKLTCARAEDYLPRLSDASVDALVTDPPGGINFMGVEWDSDRGGREAWVAWLAGLLGDTLRVLKPGAHALVWALPRTSHWTGTAIEMAGFEVRDRITHVFGTGMNKGKGSTLKPAAEDWWLARKPFTGTLHANLDRYGLGKLNLDACRIPTGEKLTRALGKTSESPSGWRSVKRSAIAGKDGGRVPSNFVLSHRDDCTDHVCVADCPIVELDQQSGVSVSRKGKPRASKAPGAGWGSTHTGAEYDDRGGASRFFYCAKPSRREKEAGLEGLPAGRKTAVYGAGFNSATKVRTAQQATDGVDRGEVKNTHPTVKSKRLMSYLVKLVTPDADRVVLDLFMGSGTTGLACVATGRSFIGVDKDPRSAAIAQGRIAAALNEHNRR